MHEQVFVGLGSNIPNPKYGSPEEQIKEAIHIISQQPDVTLVQASSLYKSAPMGPQDQDDYVNAVVHISCTCTADALLDTLQQIEQAFGRERKQDRWGPRTMDLDILLFDQQIIQTKRLTVPHYGLAGREFVLVPLFELAPDMVMPDGRPIAMWVTECSLKGLRRIRHESEVEETNS
ncbi:2-amino-4-hydroxy-6-hydroxymethyldihydropteridine diphosphokinase [Alteromonas facilis]|uniref:2-amino-4-hydroxy-6- hydroxymethyldihydropteridine diphosphokinase n=1 Tax=Alteromonas facilis TaxID=2048004 RepID=UPI000C28BF03|nr:2-amino-4-hydroxy-6-hydroxymethyldihydropteridine diphosphokinase [Alteromonas facilis]